VLPAPPGDPGKPVPLPPQGSAPQKPIVPQQRSDGATALEKLPQTAEEKRRQLNDLYAQLAAAENEEQAKQLSTRIERIWRLSGSDTVNLLISRAIKVASEKRTDLANKLLDSAVELAPDYTEGFSQRAFFHYSQSNMLAAVGDLRRVLALDPNHYKAMEGLVQVWRDTGNKKGAYEVLKQLLDVNPFAAGAKQAYDELKREVEGRGI
jgi:tetratricopeptide (TPR) repeat protein